MKVVVTGGRDFADRRWVYRCLDNILHGHGEGVPQSPLTHIIHGGAKGADKLASEWAQECGIQEVVCIANWGKFDKRAGVLRNLWMLDLLNPETDLVYPCPGGQGTQHCINTAVELGLKFYRPYAPAYEERLERMFGIARGRINDEEAEQEEAVEAAVDGERLDRGEAAPRVQLDGDGVPEGNEAIRPIPADMGNGVFGVGLGIGIGGGGGQAQEAYQGGLYQNNPF